MFTVVVVVVACVLAGTGAAPVTTTPPPVVTASSTVTPNICSKYSIDELTCISSGHSCTWNSDVYVCGPAGYVPECGMYPSERCPKDRCEYNENARMCHPKGQTVPCVDYDRTGCTYEAGCQWDESETLCVDCPPGVTCSGTTPKPHGTFYKKPCAEIRPEECPSDRCFFNYHNYVCEELVCDDILDAQSCENLAGCVWDTSYSACHQENVDIPCKDILAVSDCNSNSKCAFSIEGNICWDKNQHVPCMYFRGAGCTSDRGCTSYPEIDQCIEANDCPPCEYFGPDNCPSKCCTFDTKQVVCHANDVMPCADITRFDDCNTDPRCLFDFVRNECVKCPPHWTNCTITTAPPTTHIDTTPMRHDCTYYTSQETCPYEYCVYAPGLDELDPKCRDPQCVDHYSDGDCDQDEECTWDSDLNLCVESSNTPPCEMYSTNTSCIAHNCKWYSDGVCDDPSIVNPCNEYFNQTQCEAVKKCAWLPENQWCYNTNNPPDCPELPTESTCQINNLCVWNPSASGCYFNDEEVPCEDFLSQDACKEDRCHWNKIGQNCLSQGQQEMCYELTTPTTCGETYMCKWDTSQDPEGSCISCDTSDPDCDRVPPSSSSIPTTTKDPNKDENKCDADMYAQYGSFVTYAREACASLANQSSRRRRDADAIKQCIIDHGVPLPQACPCLYLYADEYKLDWLTDAC
eukprot:m.145435 g.145435  ORF g.145435 m.145435 type:complete len:689 (-) comp24276_c0_seq1:122-2188(-)